MRINKTMKEDIVRKVMEIKFPQTKEDGLKRDLSEFVRSNISFPIIPKELDNYITLKSTITLWIIYGNNQYDYQQLTLNVKSYPAKGYYDTYNVYINEKKNTRNTTENKAPKGTKELYNKRKRHLKKKAEFRVMLEGSLLSINTEKQLKDNLPELVKFLPKKNSALVPVESFKEVRKELKGL